MTRRLKQASCMREKTGSYLQRGDRESKCRNGTNQLQKRTASDTHRDTEWAQGAMHYGSDSTFEWVFEWIPYCDELN